MKVLLRPTPYRRMFQMVGFLAAALLQGAVWAFDTTPPAKITEMDIYGVTTPAGSVVFVRLDPTLTISITGFSTCTAPSNFFALTTSTDADRAVLAQLQTAYALKKTVILHVVGCGTVGTVTYPLAVGVWTF